MLDPPKLLSSSQFDRPHLSEPDPVTPSDVWDQAHGKILEPMMCRWLNEDIEAMKQRFISYVSQEAKVFHVQPSISGLQTVLTVEIPR